MSAAGAAISAVYEIVVRSADRDGWLRDRLSGIGASEIAGVLGESPYESPMSVYQAKVAPADDDEDSEHLFWGLELEPAIVGGYAKRTGRKAVHSGALLRSVEHQWALCTLDAWTTDDLDSGIWWPLEIKNIHLMAADQWLEGTPRHIYLQVQHQMLVTGAAKVTAAGLVGGGQLMWEDIARDEQEIRRIIARGSAFWHEHVLPRNPPPADGHNATKDALLRMYPEDDGETVPLDSDFFDLDQERIELKATVKACSERLGLIDNQIRAAIGDASYGELPDGTTYSYKAQSRREHVIKASTTRVLRRHERKD